MALLSLMQASLNVPGTLSIDTNPHGRVEKGRGLGAKAMASQVIEKATQKITPLKIIPGTLNLWLPSAFDGTLQGYVSIEELGGSLPGVQNRKGLRFGEVRIAGQFQGFVFQGDEPNYPSNQVEVISDHNLRQALALKDGDTVEFTLVG